MAFSGKRIRCTVSGTVQAPVDEVFPLACPVEEYKWIDGWQCNLVYSESGKVEKGCIFTESMSAPFLGYTKGSTTWFTALYDRNHHRVHFILITPISVAQYEIHMEAASADTTRAKLDLTVTGTTQQGNAFVEADAKDKTQAMLAGLARMLKHYCESGEMLRVAG